MGRRGRGDGLKAWTGGSGCTLGRQPPRSRPSPRQAAAPAPLSLAGQAAAPPQLSRLRLGTSSLKPHRGRGVRLVRPAAYPPRPPRHTPSGLTVAMLPRPPARLPTSSGVPPPQRYFSTALATTSYCGALKKNKMRSAKNLLLKQSLSIGNVPYKNLLPLPNGCSLKHN